MKKLFNLFSLFSIIMIVASCSDNMPEPEPDPSPDPVIKLTTDATLGKILTDENGMTLYFFTRDAGNNSVCQGGCLDAWPVFYIENLKLEGELEVNDFSEITRSDGEKQTTYKGWPLYYFASDTGPGTTLGEGVNNVWFVAKPDYSLMLVDAQLIGHDNKLYNANYEEGEEVVQYLVDDRGRTLYGFIIDRNNINNFTNADFSNDPVWPIYSNDLGAIPSTLDQNLVAEIDVHGRKQLTYNGWPLYYFGQDNMERGINKGISFPRPGVWPVITPDMPALADPETVLLANNETYGNILTDGEGRVLYFFTRDFESSSVCTGNCKATWPVFYEENLALSNGLLADDFGEITREDGDKQTTYKGWPLYYYIGDINPGETNGEAVGNIWFVAKPDYSVMLVNAQLIGHDGVEYKSDYTPGQENVQYMVDQNGVTLYGFINDTFDKNNFTRADFSNDPVWPIFEIEKMKFPSTLDPSLFNVIEVHGRKQLTYKGWPLYYFGQDADVKGSNKGISFPAPGVWPIVTPEIANAPAE
jgi:predicted lipoprotein with Yx(FWY)xxD motif